MTGSNEQRYNQRDRNEELSEEMGDRHWSWPWCNGYRRRKWTRVQILDEADGISLTTNTVWKGMNPIILSPAMGK